MNITRRVTGDIQRIKSLTYRRQMTFKSILIVDENLSISEFAQRKTPLEKGNTHSWLLITFDLKVLWKMICSRTKAKIKTIHSRSVTTQLTGTSTLWLGLKCNFSQFESVSWRRGRSFDRSIAKIISATKHCPDWLWELMNGSKTQLHGYKTIYYLNDWICQHWSSVLKLFMCYLSKNLQTSDTLLNNS